MGRPDDVRRRNQTPSAGEVDILKDLVKQQADMIKSLVETLSKVQNQPINISLEKISTVSSQPENPETHDPSFVPRPKMDDFFINPSPEIKITSSNIEENKEEKIVQENVDEEAEKLKQMMKGRIKK